METYSTLRGFADSWGLLALTLFFLGAALWAFRPGAKAHHDAAASIPLRERAPDAPERDSTPCGRGCPGCACGKTLDFGARP